MPTPEVKTPTQDVNDDQWVAEILNSFINFLNQEYINIYAQHPEFQNDEDFCELGHLIKTMKMLAISYNLTKLGKTKDFDKYYGDYVPKKIGLAEFEQRILKAADSVLSHVKILSNKVSLPKFLAFLNKVKLVISVIKGLIKFKNSLKKDTRVREKLQVCVTKETNPVASLTKVHKILAGVAAQQHTVHPHAAA